MPSVLLTCNLHLGKAVSRIISGSGEEEATGTVSHHLTGRMPSRCFSEGCPETPIWRVE